ncbi:MAG: MipA/OmpV family protein [Gammaproteobacteria bacterium]|nr:MipA/OmpV family protein [Gammaproteobacteria bacterium]
MIRRIRQLLLMLLVCGASPCLADTAAEQGTESRWRLGAALGYGLRSNPLIQSDDIPIIVDFDVAWFGDHWFFDNGDLGLTLSDNALFTASIVARVNSDRVFFGNTDTRFVSFDLTGAPLSEAVAFSVPDRDYAVELGLEMLAGGSWGALQLSGFHDVSGTHDGYELYANYSYGWREQRLYVEPSIGVSYKSARLNNYYWGVTAEEGGIVVARYDATAGINWQARLLLGYQLSRNWGVSLVTEYERINDEAAASPIVDERNVLGFFAGLAYRF